MKSVLTAVAILAATTGVASARTVYWADWSAISASGSAVAITGTIDVAGKSIGVTYTNPNGIGFFNAGIGQNHWGASSAANSPYTSTGPKGVDNGPGTADLIALRYAGGQTLTFSETVSDVYFSFISLNGNGYGFDRDFQLLSAAGQNIDGAGTDAGGAFGSGGVEKHLVNGQYRLVGTSGEPHGTILLDGQFDSLSWQSLSNEYWNGFTIGIGEFVPDPDPSAVPLPAAGGMLLGALGAFGMLRRRV